MRFTMINFRNLLNVLLISAFSLLFLNFAQLEKQVNKGKGKVVGLDYFFNHEFKNDKEGKKIQFHYIWEDEENSGYSVLGKIIQKHGASISEIKKAPSDSDLKKLSIYIIVDPDTPLETASPNYISDSSITVIERWIKKGGVLVLFA